MTPSGTSPDGTLVEVVELQNHPWFLAVQYHPEFKSQPNHAHPLFKGFIEAAMNRRHAHRGSSATQELGQQS